MSIFKPKMFWPMTITSANKVIYFHEATAGNLSANIPEAVYYSADTLRAAIQTAMRAAHANVASLLAVVGAGGVWVFINGTAIKFRWSVTTNSAAALLGFPNSDTSPSVSQIAPYQHQNGWYSDVAVNEDSLPIRDRKMDVVTRTNEGQTKYLTESELINRMLRLKFLKPEKTYIAFESTNLNQAIERLWDAGRSRFRYWPDATDEATYYDYVLDQETIQEFKPKRQFTKKALYEMELGIFGFVA